MAFLAGYIPAITPIIIVAANVNASPFNDITIGRSLILNIIMVAIILKNSPAVPPHHEITEDSVRN